MGIDKFSIFNKSNLQDWFYTLQSCSKNTELHRFQASEPTKGNRFGNPNIDLEASLSPLKNTYPKSKQLTIFLMKLLLSTLPTKPVVRRTNWFKSLSDEARKKQIYDNEFCSQCPEVIESHYHIFNECPARIPFRDKFCTQILFLVNHGLQNRFYNLPWWFSTHQTQPAHKPPTNSTNISFDLTWRGFLPKTLKETLKTKMNNKSAENLMSKIAFFYAQNNLEIWNHRCKVLYGEEC